MNPKDLFNDALTKSRHEIGELHFVGESLPIPSQVFDGVNNSASSLGQSPIPAREDHVHNIDLSNYYTQAEVDAAIAAIDLSNYYTKTETDALFSALDYYTQAQVDALFAALDYYTQAEVDSLIAGVGGGPGSFAWSYDALVVNPTSTTYGDTWFPPASITITKFYCTAQTAAGTGKDYIITLWVDGVNEESFILSAGSTYEEDAGLTIAALSTDSIEVSVAKDGSFVGDLEGLCIVIEFDYD